VPVSPPVTGALQNFSKALCATKARPLAVAIATVGQTASALHPTPAMRSKLTRLFVRLITAAMACAPATLSLFDNAAHH